MGDGSQAREARPRGRKPAPGRRTRAAGAGAGRKTALVLGGGGFTGGVYEIGALRALDLLAVNRTVNQFDVYVGTSAGSFVASLAANGVTPEEMMRVVNQQVPTPFRDVDRGTLMRPNLLEFAQSAALMPLRLLGLGRNFLGQPGRQLGDRPRGGPRGGAAVGHVRQRGDPGVPRDGAGRPGPHATTSACSRTSCCSRPPTSTPASGSCSAAPDWDDVPISRAVAASTALPMVYKPVEIKGRHLVDGGIRSTTNVDLAVEHGAKFVIVVNPLVPYVNDFQKVIPTMLGSRVRRVADMGFPQIGYQAFKLLAHQRLHEAVKHWEEKYPGVDIILIEPDPNDELMFETNILNFTKRVEIARHGFESVTIKLAEDYDRVRDDRRQARHRDLGHPRPQGHPQVRQGARAHRGLAADPRADHRRAAAAVRRRLGGRGRQADACAGASSRRSVAPELRIAARTWSSAPSGPPGATSTPSRSSAAASCAPRAALGPQPDEVGLALVGVDRQLAQRLEQAAALADHRAAPALDLGAADLERLDRPPTG